MCPQRHITILRRMNADTVMWIALEAIAVLAPVLLVATIVLLAAPGPQVDA